MAACGKYRRHASSFQQTDSSLRILCFINPNRLFGLSGLSGLSGQHPSSLDLLGFPWFLVFCPFCCSPPAYPCVNFLRWCSFLLNQPNPARNRHRQRLPPNFQTFYRTFPRRTTSFTLTSTTLLSFGRHLIFDPLHRSPKPAARRCFEATIRLLCSYSFALFSFSSFTIVA